MLSLSATQCTDIFNIFTSFACSHSNKYVFLSLYECLCIMLKMFFKRLQIDLELKLVFPVGQSSVDASRHRPILSNTSEWISVNLIYLI